MAIEETFKDVANVAALAVEAASVAVVVFGALQAFARVIGLALQSAPT